MSAHTVKRRKLSPEPSGAIQSDSKPQSQAVATKTDQSFSARKNDSSTKAQSTNKAKDDRTAELATASGFYKSSFFKLQMDELLTGLRPNYE